MKHERIVVSVVSVECNDPIWVLCDLIRLDDPADEQVEKHDVGHGVRGQRQGHRGEEHPA